MRTHWHVTNTNMSMYTNMTHVSSTPSGQKVPNATQLHLDVDETNPQADDDPRPASTGRRDPFVPPLFARAQAEHFFHLYSETATQGEQLQHTHGKNKKETETQGWGKRHSEDVQVHMC